MKYAILGLMALFFTENSSAFDINSYCRQVSDAVGGSYQIEKVCRAQEYQSQAKIGSLSVPSRIKKYCEGVGQAVGGSYQIMEACIEQELQAKSSLY